MRLLLIYLNLRLLLQFSPMDLVWRLVYMNVRYLRNLPAITLCTKMHRSYLMLQKLLLHTQKLLQLPEWCENLLLVQTVFKFHVKLLGCHTTLMWYQVIPKIYYFYVSSDVTSGWIFISPKSLVWMKIPSGPIFPLINVHQKRPTNSRSCFHRCFASGFLFTNDPVFLPHSVYSFYKMLSLLKNNPLCLVFCCEELQRLAVRFWDKKEVDLI